MRTTSIAFTETFANFWLTKETEIDYVFYPPATASEKTSFSQNLANRQMDQEELFVGQGNTGRNISCEGIILLLELGALVYELDFLGLVFNAQVARPSPISIRTPVEDNSVFIRSLVIL